MSKNIFTIELGSTVKSNISGYSGTVTSRAEHINGCNRYWVAASVDKTGKLPDPDGYWFDEGELIVTKKPSLKRKNPERGGFPSSKK